MSTYPEPQANVIKEVAEEFPNIKIPKAEFYRALNMNPEDEKRMLTHLVEMGKKQRQKVSPELQKLYDEYVEALQFEDEIDQQSALKLVQAQSAFLQKARETLSKVHFAGVSQYLEIGVEATKKAIYQLFTSKISEYMEKHLPKSRADNAYKEMRENVSDVIKSAKKSVNARVNLQNPTYPLEQLRSLWIVTELDADRSNQIAKQLKGQSGLVSTSSGLRSLFFDHVLTDRLFSFFTEHTKELLTKEDAEKLVRQIKEEISRAITEEKAKGFEVAPVVLGIRNESLREFEQLISVMYSGNPVLTKDELALIIAKHDMLSTRKYADVYNQIYGKLPSKEQKAISTAVKSMEEESKKISLPLLVDLPHVIAVSKKDADVTDELINSHKLIPDTWKKVNKIRAAYAAAGIMSEFKSSVAKEALPEMPKKIDARSITLRTRAAHLKNIIGETNLQASEVRGRSMKRNGLSIENITDEFERATSLLSQKMLSHITLQEYLDFNNAIKKETELLKKKLAPFMRDEYARDYLDDVIESQKVAKEVAIQMFAAPDEKNDREGINSIGLFLKFQQYLPNIPETDSHRKTLCQHLVEQSDLIRTCMCPDVLKTTQDIDDVAMLLIYHAKFNTYYYKATLERMDNYNRTEVLTDSELREITSKYIDAIQLAVDWAKSELHMKQHPTSQNDQPGEMLPEPDPVKVLENIDAKKGIPRDLIEVIFMRASEEADRELSRKDSGFGETIERAVNMFLPDVLYTPLDMTGFLAWLYGNIVSINLGKTEGEIPDDLIKARKLNLSKMEDAFALIAAKFPDVPGLQTATIEEVIAAVEGEIKERSDVYIERDPLLDELTAGIRDAEKKFMKKRGHLLDSEFGKLPEFMDQIIERFYIIAKRHLPEKFYSPIMVRLLLGICEETFLSVYFHLKTVPNAGDAARALKQSFTQTYANILVAPNNILAESMKKVTNPKHYPLIRLQQDAQPAPLTGPKTTTPANFWKHRFGAVLTDAAQHLTNEFIESDASFPSKEQRDLTQAQLFDYFSALQKAMNSAIDVICSTNQIPDIDALRSYLTAAVLSVHIPETLHPLIRSPLELFHLELEDAMNREFISEAQGTSIITHALSSQNNWSDALAPMFADTESALADLSPEVLADAVKLVKHRAASSMVRAILQDTLATTEKTEPISADRFSMNWIPAIYAAVSGAIDDHVNREQKKGRYLEDVLAYLFSGTKQLVLRARIGSEVEKALRNSVQGDIVRKMRTSSSADLLKGDAPDEITLAESILSSSGRVAELPLLERETQIIDQFLRQTLSVSGGAADEQMLNHLDAITTLADELNNHCHFGYYFRKPDDLLPALAERGVNVLEDMITSAEAQPSVSPSSPEAQKLLSLVRENAEWIARWPTGAKTSDAQAGFLQMLMRWHELSVVATQQIARGSSVATGRALLDARCVAMAREKNIVTVKENGRNGNAKISLQVTHYKIRALLDWREAQETPGAVQSDESVDMRATGVILDVQSLGRELAALESTLQVRGDEQYSVSLQALTDAEETLRQNEASLASITESLASLEAQSTQIRSQLPSLIGQLQGLLVLDAAERQALEQEECDAAASVTEQQERLIAYSSSKRSDMQVLSDITAALQQAEELHLAAQKALTLFHTANASQSVTDALLLLQSHADTNLPASDVQTDDRAQLIKKAQDFAGVLDETELLRDEKTSVEAATNRARLMHRGLAAQNGGRHAPTESTESLRRRHKQILGILTDMRSLLRSLTNDNA